ncbi:MAG: murein biosynthesis integral membrane protein MurJ [Patescibacteria group bacterium]
MKFKTNSIASAAIVVGSFSVLSRFFGFIRDRILAGTFGAGDTLDAYFAAFRIPDLIFQLVIVGALSASFIPVFTKYYKKEHPEEAWRFTNAVLNIMAILFGCAVVAAIVFAGPLAAVIAPGFGPEKQALVAQFSQYLFFAQFLLALSMVFGSVLQGAKRFFLYSLAPVLYNVGIIIGILYLVPMCGPMGLVWGVIIGAGFHFLLQVVGAFAIGYRYQPTMRMKREDRRYLAVHLLPRVLGLAVGQINVTAMTILASGLAVGSVAIFQFAFNLDYFTVGVIGISYAIAAFPTLCELSSAGQKEGFIETLSSTIRQMLLFLVPATILFLLLRAQIVRVVLGAGVFDWDATIATANALGWFVLSLFAQSIVFVLVRAYFAKHDTWTPFVIGLFCAILNVVIALLLAPSMGVAGLAIAFSASSMVQLALLWVLLRLRLGTLHESRILYSLLKFSIAGFFTAFAVQGMKYAIVTVISLDTFWGVLGQGFIAGMVGLVVYTGITLLLRSEEMIEFFMSIRRKFLRKVKTTEVIVTEIDT